MKFVKFSEEKPKNGEYVLIWFYDSGSVESAIDFATFSQSPDASYWSCESDGEIFHPDEWCRIVPPSSFFPD
jgi:hypothetical protein